MKVLLHTCCGPCTIVPLRELRSEGLAVHGLFANPNIHPYTEWRKRQQTFAQFAESEDLALLPVQEYAPAPWLQAVCFREGNRCSICYHLRLRHAARIARRGRFEAFTSSLLYSKFQLHDTIREIGEAVGSELGIRFLYRDWRTGWSEGVAESKALGMYRQSYCGCIYSEAERYAPRAAERQ